MKKTSLQVILFLLLASGAFLTVPAGEQMKIGACAVEKDTKEFPLPAWREAEFEFDFPVPENIRPILYAGADYQGHPTEVFAWVGVPAQMPEGEKAPGIVLVHGGGGTAFLQWVEQWTARGYCAIAMDTVGYRPLLRWEAKTGVRSRLPGNRGPEYQVYERDLQNPEDAWTTQAVEAIRRGHTLLRSLPEIDPERTAIYGISWGGYLTCFAAAADSRFKAAVSVYGCGFLPESRDTVKHAPDEWFQLFDPARVLPEVKCPFLFINRPDDTAYEWSSWRRSAMLPAHAVRSVPGCFGHSHTCGLRPEGEVFIDSIVNGAAPLPQIGPLEVQGNRVAATVHAGTEPIRGELWWSSDSAEIPEPRRAWRKMPATCDGNVISAELPEGATDYFLNAVDSRGVAVTAFRIVSK